MSINPVCYGVEVWRTKTLDMGTYMPTFTKYIDMQREKINLYYYILISTLYIWSNNLHIFYFNEVKNIVKLGTGVPDTSRC